MKWNYNTGQQMVGSKFFWALKAAAADARTIKWYELSIAMWHGYRPVLDLLRSELYEYELQ